LLCHGMVCVVGRIRDLILQLSKSSIYSTKPNNRSIPLTNLKISVQKVVLFYCALAGQHQKIRNFPGINIHHFYTNDAKTVSPIR
ncbi:hypothetical protein M3B34_24345, partial [Klebsiella quasipneumoniae]|nr:hypothetical protein [Klebsiella quasipneumoniae]